jgi:hypothetical protein
VRVDVGVSEGVGVGVGVWVYRCVRVHNQQMIEKKLMAGARRHAHARARAHTHTHTHTHTICLVVCHLWVQPNHCLVSFVERGPGASADRTVSTCQGRLSSHAAGCAVRPRHGRLARVGISATRVGRLVGPLARLRCVPQTERCDDFISSDVLEQSNRPSGWQVLVRKRENELCARTRRR